MIDRPHSTVGISPQPDVLQSLQDKPGFRGQGLLARFLYALPKSRIGYRTLTPRPIPSDIEGRYRTGIHQLINFQSERPLRLQFSGLAHDAWKNFQRSLEHDFRDGCKLHSLKDWGAKLPGATARLAGILHIVLHSGADQIETEIALTTAAAAIELAKCLISHALAVFALMVKDPAVNDAEKNSGLDFPSEQDLVHDTRMFPCAPEPFPASGFTAAEPYSAGTAGYIRRLKQTT